MSKIFLRTMLNNKTDNKFFSCESSAIINDDKIKYIDNNVTVVLKLEEDGIIINRRSDEYDILLPLRKGCTTKGVYNIKKIGHLNLDVKTNDIYISKEKIKVDYTMILDNVSKSDFEYIIEFVEGE